MPGSVLIQNQLPQSPNATQVFVGDISRLQSGKWVGHFVDPRFNDERDTWPMDLFLVLKNKAEFWGFGRDDVDVFTVDRGTMTGQQVKFVKAYRSHVIYYSGHINQQGTHIGGNWSFYSTNPGEGTFSIWREPV